MPRINVIQSGMTGVDMKTNPLFLPKDRMAAATNIVFEEGEIRTRPGFRYHCLGAEGKFQGAAIYSPSRGLSHQPFADPYTALVTVVGGKIRYNLSKDCYFDCPVEITGGATISKHDVNLFQAENYLIVQSPFGDTLWWEGYGPYTISPGLNANEDTVRDLLLQAEQRTREFAGANIDCCFQKIEVCDVVPYVEPDELFSSHDTLEFEKHRNFLINSAGLGIYTNGRIHQESRVGIFVSDIIHKRGNKFTDDILLMEEQEAGSFGEPLSASSKLGQLRAMEVLPRMNTPNGEGQLIAYYDYGVVAFNTFEFPRETRFNAEDESLIQKGWSEIRQVSHLLNRISATGRYAVGVLPRDHAFRSRYGIHLMSVALGEGTFKDEYINTLSQDVQPILDADTKDSLRGVSVGQWPEGSRILTTVGMVSNEIFTSSTMGRGFVVWNQATTFTEDRTPRPVWEGLWSVHSEIAGIHRLLDATEVNGDNLFGFVASKCDASLLFGEIDKNLDHDVLDDEPVQIEWDITSRKVFQSFDELMKLTDGRVEVEATGAGGRIRVMVRTDSSPEWAEWHEETTSDSDDTTLHSITLGMPPKGYREASWFQFRIEGLGATTIRSLEIDASSERSKRGRVITEHSLTTKKENYHKINTKPATSRWT